MFGKRPDGRLVKNMPPIQKIMPYVMKKRYDAMNMYEEFFPTEGMDAFIKAKSAEGKYDDILFTGFDAGTKQLNWIKENGTPLLIGSVAQDSIDMGYQAVMQCIIAVEGGTAEDVAIAGAWYNAENLIDMLDSNLIYTDAPEDADALRK